MQLAIKPGNELTGTVVVELDCPGIGDVGRSFKPLRSLDAILIAANEIDDTLRIESTSIGNCSEKDAVQPVDLCAMFRSLCWRLVDGFESNQARLAG